MANLYAWLKVAHILAVIAFMAGMFYLPRLFVYHASVAKGSAQSELFKVMERRLDLGIMRPALFLVYATGVALALKGGFFAALWLNLKLALVLLMTAAYGYLILARHRFVADANRRSPGFYRFVNEIPTLLLIAIVALVVIKPWA